MQIDSFIRKITNFDIEPILAIENEAYEFPWSKGIFLDCLTSSYHCYTYEVDDEIRNKIEKQIEEEIFDDLEVAIVKALQKVKPEERVHLLKKTKKENLSIIVSFLILTVVIIIFSLVILAKTNPAFDTSDGKNIYFFNNCRINERFDCSITYYDDYFEMNIINTYPTSSTITYIDVGGCELYPNEHNQKIKLVFEDCIPNNNEITLHYSITASNLEKETKGTIVKRIPITPIIKLIS